ncbi:hypothetical protein BS17DRAFT_793916 [Gyrodon lividus]|nr:hypothetical protein BS17DRAFT_793916 [Gyrodon lividus]
MVGHAKSQSRKHHIISTHQEGAIAAALLQYNQNKQKSKEERRCLRAICREVQEEWRAQKKDKKIIEENIVAYLLDLAAWGFPLTHKTLKLHVDTLLRARLGEAFPETGVGHNWTDCFATRHADCIAQYWSSPLDTARGRAVNPHTHKAWCNLLKETLKREKIEEDCLWAADETGFQPGGRTRQRVFGPAKKKIQHQQCDGNRENITVMVTICANGEDIVPTDFNKKTYTKANGRARLLLVNGHNFHYTKDFLDYARHHNIHVLCYPAHATHIYQGLDVAIFGPLKNCWTEERDQYESSTSYHAVITPQNICSAFEKTGVWPFNPDMVTPETMASSLETSARGQLPLP